MSIIGRKSRAPDGTAADLTAPFLLAAMLWITAAFLYAAHGDLALTGLLSAIGLATVVYAVRPLVRQKSQQQPAANPPDIAILDTTLGPLDAGFMMFDDTDHLVYVNEAARRIFPKARDAMVPGAYFEDILRAGVNRGAVPAAADDPEAWIADRVDRQAEAVGQSDDHAAARRAIQLGDDEAGDIIHRLESLYLSMGVLAGRGI